MSNEQEKINRELKKFPLDSQELFQPSPLDPPPLLRNPGRRRGRRGPLRAVCQGCRDRRASAHHDEYREECDLHLVAGAPEPHRHLRLQDGSRNHAGQLQSRDHDGIVFPTGLLPNLAGQLNDFAIVRSMRSHALVHSLAQTWTQIGRNPAAALGNIAPNIGSIVAIEKDKERQPGQVFPSFLALNSGGGVGGRLPAGGLCAL